MVAAMTRTLALASLAVAAAVTFVPPANAACDLPQQTVPSCLKPALDRLKSLCFPPDPTDLYGC
jgi:hypothetical protein